MKNKELTRDEICLLRDVMDTILDERETRKVFNQIHGTTTRELDKLATKLATLAQAPVVVVPPPRGKGEHLWHEHDGVTKCVTCFRDEDDANVGGEKCSYKAPKSVKPCRKCGSPLNKKGLCIDLTCPYSDNKQNAFARHQESLMTRHCTYCGADLPGDNGDCGKCGL
jgi:ribosomal protein L40E